QHPAPGGRVRPRREGSVEAEPRERRPLRPPLLRRGGKTTSSGGVMSPSRASLLVLFGFVAAVRGADPDPELVYSEKALREAGGRPPGPAAAAPPPRLSPAGRKPRPPRRRRAPPRRRRLRRPREGRVGPGPRRPHGPAVPEAGAGRHGYRAGAARRGV